MKLTEKENLYINELVDEYKNLYLRIDIINEEIEKLRKKEYEVIDELDKIRAKESKFSDIITRKYGDVKLDLETRKIIKNE